ncbi:MAG: helix-turn-helix domain-containing protein [Caldilineaceae bacterium]
MCRPPNNCIEQRIIHEELAAMVGTTRPRISTFMRRFQELGRIEFSAERFLIVKEMKLSAYLGQSA